LSVNACSLLHEILASEVLTRVWSAVVALHDRRTGTADAEPVVRSVWLGHLEARRRALTILVRGPGVDSHEAVVLNHLRRRAERWNDMFIGHLAVHGEVSEFAFDAELADEFARDFRGRHAWQQGGVAWAIVMASLRAESHNAFPDNCPNRDLNDQIGAAILGCFGYDVFDSLGLPRSLWIARMLQTADSARGLIEEMVAAENPQNARLRDFPARP
jgi:predicted nucleic acid-binding protein